MHTVNKIPELKAFHDKLVAKGKKTMTAQYVCMRKILLILGCMAMENRLFNENFSKKVKKILDFKHTTLTNETNRLYYFNPIRMGKQKSGVFDLCP